MKNTEEILKEFPNNYQELIYCEPFCGNCNVFFKKQDSKISVLNDPSPGIYKILTALQNDKKEFSKKIQKIKINKTIFEKQKVEKKFKNELEEAINQYFLFRFSKGGLCKSFQKSIRNNCDTWNTGHDEFESISKKLQCVFILNKDPLEVVRNFNNDDVLLFCNLPLWNKKHIQSAYKPKLEEKDHIEISKNLLNFQGKVILTNLDSSLYKKLYKSFNKKKIKNKKEYIWKNF